MRITYHICDRYGCEYHIEADSYLTAGVPIVEVRLGDESRTTFSLDAAREFAQALVNAASQAEEMIENARRTAAAEKEHPHV